MLIFGGRGFRAEGTASAKALRQEYVLHKNRKTFVSEIEGVKAEERRPGKSRIKWCRVSGAVEKTAGLFPSVLGGHWMVMWGQARLRGHVLLVAEETVRQEWLALGCTGLSMVTRVGCKGYKTLSSYERVPSVSGGGREAASGDVTRMGTRV